MKLTALKLTFTLSLLFAGWSLSAQQQQQWGPEWGENATQEERYQNVALFNFYKDAYEQNRYDEAMKYYYELLEKAPKSLSNLYVFARNIYVNKINKSRSVPERRLLTDTLMMIYDARLEHMGDDPKYGTPYILRNKAIDYLAFKGTDREGVRQAFDEAFRASEEPHPTFILRFFSELTEDYKNMNIETEPYMEYYEAFSEQLEQVTDDPEIEKKRNTLDELFMSSGAADCAGIERIYKDRIEANPEDEQLLHKVFNIMSRGNCATPFFFNIGEKLFQIQKAPGTAMALARAYEKNGNMNKSMEFRRQAVDAESNPMEKAKLCTEIAGIYVKNGNGRLGADFANTALRYDSRNGYARIFLAQAYNLGASGCSDAFDKGSVYWLAVDQLTEARKVFSANSPEHKQVGDLIEHFRKMFPPRGELFFRGLNNGDAYQVKCGWVTGSTTVRESPASDN